MFFTSSLTWRPIPRPTRHPTLSRVNMAKIKGKGDKSPSFTFWLMS
jgi:hypothetical protein